MATSPYVEISLAEPTRGFRYLVRDAMRVYKRFIWVICASISLISARHLLVEQNIHYPLQLYFGHIAVAGFIASRPFWTWEDTPKLLRARPQPSRFINRGTVLVTASMCFASLSTICTLQAVLHVQNLPTLVMMIVRLSSHHI